MSVAGADQLGGGQEGGPGLNMSPVTCISPLPPGSWATQSCFLHPILIITGFLGLPGSMTRYPIAKPSGLL